MLSVTYIAMRISTAELCCKHNVHPQTFHNWKHRFMESGKAGLSQSGKKDPIKTMKKREEGYKRLGMVKSRSVGLKHASQTGNPECCVFTILWYCTLNG